MLLRRFQGGTFLKEYRFHLVSLAHLPQHKKFMSCAFTQKNRKLAKMLTSLGHTVFFYGSEASDVAEYCNSDKLIFVETHKLEDIQKDYGDGYCLDDDPSVNYSVENSDFRHDFNTKEKKPSTLKFYDTCIREISQRKRYDDFLLCTQGHYHRPIADHVNLYLTCEPGIGYRGSCFRFRAFESAYIQNFTYGSQHPFECINGHHYDRVIPNYFDPADIEFSAEKDDYYLFIGRMIKRKGIMIAYHACKAIGAKLLIAGQGATVLSDGTLTAITDPDFALPPGTWEYVGYADVDKRKRLMARAIATFTPTEYLECFAGTHVESMLSGTPVLTTNFGVFPGTFADGWGGYHCDTLDDFVWAAKQVKDLDPFVVRKHAQKYLMDHVKWEFQKWFDDLYQVYLSTCDPTIKGWHHIRDVDPQWRTKLF